MGIEILFWNHEKILQKVLDLTDVFEIVEKPVSRGRNDFLIQHLIFHKPTGGIIEISPRGSQTLSADSEYNVINCGSLNEYSSVKFKEMNLREVEMILEEEGLMKEIDKRV